MVDIIYRTNNPPTWTGVGRRLFASEADQNMHNLKTAVEALQADRPEPNEIVSITASGLTWIVSLEGGTQYTVPVQVLQWRWREVWTPDTLYLAFDGFMVEGIGLFSVLQDHISAAVFDRDAQLGGEPVYNALYIDGTAANASIIYDMGFFYEPKLSDNASGVLWELPVARGLILPTTGHFARMRELATTQQQVLPILRQDIQIGTITFPVGTETGTISITAETTYNAGEMLGIGKPPLADATAARLSVMFAARRVLEA